MAINQNHIFEDLNGIKCSIVEKGVLTERVDFLRRLLEYNRFTVIVVPSPPPPPPKTAPVAGAPAAATPAVAGQAPNAKPEADVPAPAPLPSQAPEPLPPVPPAPETFTVGVTDTMFNPINAIFGRLLKTPDGHTVTLAYWQQKEDVSSDEVPYFEGK
jgi:hypothetical protein